MTEQMKPLVIMIESHVNMPMQARCQKGQNSLANTVDVSQLDLF